MSNQEKNQEQFDQYLEGTLSAIERESFEQQLQTDVAMNQAFENHRLLVDGIKLHGRKLLLGKVKEWEEALSEPDDQRLVGISSKFRWYYFAAAFALIATAVSIIYMEVGTSYADLATAYYKPYEYIPAAQRGEMVMDASEQMYSWYDQGNYEKTIAAIEEIETAQRTDLMVFILANSYQAQGNYASAIPLFQQIMEMETVYKQGASWYLALCYLSENNKDSAIELLQELGASHNPYAARAKNLLAELD